MHASRSTERADCLLHQELEKGAGFVDKVKVYYDQTGNTLCIWFDQPKKEHLCEEIADDMVLMKDRRGCVIGIERLNYMSRKQHGAGANLPVEVQML
ncbi:MAG TPA: DUF2283 domain-containing protein [Gemmataceae bacterium]|jgi:uncharacterized protein YuzE